MSRAATCKRVVTQVPAWSPGLAGPARSPAGPAWLARPGQPGPAGRAGWGPARWEASGDHGAVRWILAVGTRQAVPRGPADHHLPGQPAGPARLRRRTRPRLLARGARRVHPPGLRADLAVARSPAAAPAHPVRRGPRRPARGAVRRARRPR